MGLEKNLIINPDQNDMYCDAVKYNLRIGS